MNHKVALCFVVQVVGHGVWYVGVGVYRRCR